MPDEQSRAFRLCLRTRSGFERLVLRLTASGCIDDTFNIACFAVLAGRKTARSQTDDGVLRQSLVAAPQSEEALAQAVGRTHFRYTQYINRFHRRSGHLWQGRFYSCALDTRHFWTATKYIELNPVQASCQSALRTGADSYSQTGSMVL